MALEPETAVMNGFDYGCVGKNSCTGAMGYNNAGWQSFVPCGQGFLADVCYTHLRPISANNDLFFFPHKNRLFPHNVQISPQCTNFPTNCDFPYKGVYFSPQ